MGEIKRYYTEEIEKSRKKIRNGDVFVVKIKGHDLYFYGKVIEVKAKYKNIVEPILIFIYKTPTTEIVVPDDMDESDVLTILFNNSEGWRVGHFKTICNILVKEEELNLDYGFESISHGKWIDRNDVEKYSVSHKLSYYNDGRIFARAYVDGFNNILDHIPKIISKYELGLFSLVNYKISKYLHENPDLKKKYGLE